MRERLWVRAVQDADRLWARGDAEPLERVCVRSEDALSDVHGWGACARVGGVAFEKGE